MLRFQPDIPPHIAEVIRHLSPDLKRSVKAALRTLCVKPNEGEPLVKELAGFWKYRVKRFRIVYAIDQRHKVIRVVGIDHRRSVYEAVTEFVQHR